MTTSSTTSNPNTATRRSHDVICWLGLAASPTFALMAWISANDPQAMMCSPASGLLPIGGMAWMYALMGLFHLSPWLTVFSNRKHRRT